MKARSLRQRLLRTYALLILLVVALVVAWTGLVLQNSRIEHRRQEAGDHRGVVQEGAHEGDRQHHARLRCGHRAGPAEQAADQAVQGTGLAQAGHPAGTETSLFMIPGPADALGRPAKVFQGPPVCDSSQRPVQILIYCFYVKFQTTAAAEGQLHSLVQESGVH